MPCSLCDWWSKSDVVQRSSNAFTRKCVASGKKVQADTAECKYFNPVFFHCDHFGQRITFNQCLARRRNEKKLGSWDNCKKCRQFDREIRQVIEKYFLDLVPIVTPRRIARIERRKAQNDSGSGRKIKRRTRNKDVANKAKDVVRKIKRRNGKSPLQEALNVLLQPKQRKIKRRK